MSFFGKNIRKIRIAKNMNQTEFAELFDLKRTALGSYEEGRAEAKTDTLIKIVEYFNISLDQLLRKEITVNEIFHFTENYIEDNEIPFITKNDCIEFLNNSSKYLNSELSVKVSLPSFVKDSIAAVFLPFDYSGLSLQSKETYLLIITRWSEKNRYFIGLYNDKICIGQKKEESYIAESGDGLIENFDFSLLKNKKSVVQVLTEV